MWLPYFKRICFVSSLHVIASLEKKHQKSHRQSKESLLNVEVAVQGWLYQADFGIVESNMMLSAIDIP